MYFGAHVSIQPSLDQAPLNAAALGAEVFQIFSQSPRGGTRKMPSEELIAKFKKNFKKAKMKACFVHTPYFINLASKNNRIYYGSVSAIKHDLEVASRLGAEGVVTHLGSAKDYGTVDKKTRGIKAIPDEAREQVLKGIEKIFEGYTGKAKLLLEIAAGAGNIIGSDLEQVAYFVQQGLKRIEQKDKMPDQKKLKRHSGSKNFDNKLGICLDTAHAFEAGTDLRKGTQVKGIIDEIETELGMEKLGLLHINDSKTKLGSASDRHEHLGMGELGLAPFTALVKDKRLRGKAFIVETPTLEGMKEDIELLKGLRQQYN